LAGATISFLGRTLAGGERGRRGPAERACSFTHAVGRIHRGGGGDFRSIRTARGMKAPILLGCIRVGEILGMGQKQEF